MQDPKEAIDQIVRTCRARGLNLHDACKAVGVNIATLNRWRAGKTQPRYANLLKILDAVERLAKKRGRAA
jgi:transcriptional regulator with XRE-family HTH domain